VKVRAFGDAALLVELDDLDAVLGLAAAVRAERPDGVLDVVPAARTLLLVVEPGTALDAVKRRVTTLSSASGAPVEANAEPVDIPVTYDGPDLAEVARLTGLDEEGVVAAHTGTPWRIAFGGFAPGFAYLTGGDPRLQVPRRDEPRTTVPAGAVGLAGEYSGVYPRPSPGGWQLIGRTDTVLWDADRDPPALLTPGGTVTFRAL
jgi:KipI family sensor histidine kinase inhibitor